MKRFALGYKALTGASLGAQIESGGITMQRNFNEFNHTQFPNRNGTFNSSRFGLVTSAARPHIGQLSLKFLW